jgi:hypothetical protein
VQDKFRQQLQALRDVGLLIHVSSGVWRFGSPDGAKNSSETFSTTMLRLRRSKNSFAIILQNIAGKLTSPP